MSAYCVPADSARMFSSSVTLSGASSSLGLHLPLFHPGAFLFFTPSKIQLSGFGESEMSLRSRSL